VSDDLPDAIGRDIVEVGFIDQVPGPGGRVAIEEIDLAPCSESITRESTGREEDTEFRNASLVEVMLDPGRGTACDQIESSLLYIRERFGRNIVKSENNRFPAFSNATEQERSEENGDA
jgi:hypothetical protein